MVTQGWTGTRTRIAGMATLTAAALLIGGCGPKDDGEAGADGTAAASASASVSPSPSPSPSPSVTASRSPSPSASPAVSKPAPPRTPAAPPATTRPPKPTVLSMYASAGGGHLSLVRGGAAREFTVTVSNGNTRAYGALRVVFQMEMMIGDEGATPPQNGFTLERRDPASGTWKAVELRVANDVQPHYLFSGGAPLAKETLRRERYRISAGDAGPTGSTALMIRLVDTTAPESAPYERGVPAATSLTVTADRG